MTPAELRWRISQETTEALLERLDAADTPDHERLLIADELSVIPPLEWREDLSIGEVLWEAQRAHRRYSSVRDHHLSSRPETIAPRFSDGRPDLEGLYLGTAAALLVAEAGGILDVVSSAKSAGEARTAAIRVWRPFAASHLWLACERCVAGDMAPDRLHAIAEALGIQVDPATLPALVERAAAGARGPGEGAGPWLVRQMTAALVGFSAVSIRRYLRALRDEAREPWLYVAAFASRDGHDPWSLDVSRLPRPLSPREKLRRAGQKAAVVDPLLGPGGESSVHECPSPRREK